ncbi:MAG: hypothetical protein MR705_03305 [Flintibacter sp.]|uniref:sodium:solute symporter family transporter n=1 Tax=Flintibacter sp. TaxID=1918624 RepID=UPI001F3F3CC3|nr:MULTISPECIES: hypothetical protein [Eubacteriales]MDY5038273.1 hypothetical protein [Lawsonibacter sp.]MCF2675653.1 hypothetical protein [Pseudoflavonifractor phocaeensis]MCI6149455.1 hypothetical protein [Flintibacter sp.]MCI7659508.1 hypothetical protein [Flintibacter sp.]MDD7117206.1 hypothetical protein [Flintibacter sp.]
MDLGFTISASTQQAIMIVFILYTAIIVGLGAYVKFASRNENSSQKLAGFLTGGGNLGSLAVGLIMVTNIMSSGGMVGGPGMSYGTGFIWSLCVFCSFINIFMSLGSVGKKMSILGRRTGAQTVLGLFRHRYQSKVFSTFLGLSFIIFLIPYSASQFTGGGRLFAVVTGTGNYRIGVLLFAVITLVYTLTGGIKSISKIAVFQGAIMIFSVISIYVVTGGAILEEYGSLQAAMEFVQESKPSLLDATTWAPLYFIGTACVQSFALIPLPPAMAGIVIAGAVAAIQSTVAAFFIIIASTIVKDIYKTLVKPDMTMEEENKGNMIFTTLAAVVAIVFAMFPSEYLQTIVNFAIGGLASGFFFPLFFGLYWKKATPAAGIFGTISGTLVYIVASSVSSPIHPILCALAVSGIGMLVVSQFTPKVKRGVFEVWFGEHYDERYAKIS